MLVILVKESDNTAFFTLNNDILTPDEVLEARLAMGLPPPEDPYTTMSPKSYTNILRSLYLSSYLRRPFSEKALSIMLETDFDSGIPAFLPHDIKIAHKIGFYQQGGYFHDCGIIYLPYKPYSLCIMSKNTTYKK